jgi:hypothetical protein
MVGRRQVRCPTALRRQRCAACATHYYVVTYTSGRSMGGELPALY